MPDQPTPANPLSSLAVIGGGFMGSGIAESAAAVGIDVIVYEPAPEPLEASRQRFAASLGKLQSRGKLSPEDAQAMTDRVTYTNDMDDLAHVDGAVEAVIEKVAVKTAVFEQLDAKLPRAAFLATNTSSIAVAEIAAATARPERVVGLHFFSPVPVMKLVEVVSTLDADAGALNAAEAFVRQIRKEPIRTKDRSGFVVNVLLVPYLMSGMRLLEEGFATAEDIDQGMRLGCGHPMGPLELSDFIGLDTLLLVCESLYDEFKRPDFAPPTMLKRLVVAGHHGRKSGRGFYRYGEKAN
jgi:3-hydroxybutyryl-CoA dehydrogenase